MVNAKIYNSFRAVLSNADPNILNVYKYDKNHAQPISVQTVHSWDNSKSWLF